MPQKEEKNHHHANEQQRKHFLETAAKLADSSPANSEATPQRRMLVRTLERANRELLTTWQREQCDRWPAQNALWNRKGAEKFF